MAHVRATAGTEAHAADRAHGRRRSERAHSERAADRRDDDRKVRERSDNEDSRARAPAREPGKGRRIDAYA